jgi:hypothetical protein
MRAARVAAFALAGLVVGTGASAVGFTPTSQDRSVEVASTLSTLQCMPPPSGCTPIAPPVNSSDSESAPDFSPFVATAALPGGYAATQDSSLSSTSISAQGSAAHSGSGAYFSPPPGGAHVSNGSSDSHFEVAFDVDTPTPYRLHGHVSANGGLTANTVSSIRLRTAGGTVIEEVVAATDYNCQDSGCAQVGPLPIHREDVLAPGSYVLEASSAGSAAPFFFALNFYDLASTGSYDVTLAIVEVPALPPFALAGLALGLSLAAAPFLARARR